MRFCLSGYIHCVSTKFPRYAVQAIPLLTKKTMVTMRRTTMRRIALASMEQPRRRSQRRIFISIAAIAVVTLLLVSSSSATAFVTSISTRRPRSATLSSFQQHQVGRFSSSTSSSFSSALLRAAAAVPSAEDDSTASDGAIAESSSSLDNNNNNNNDLKKSVNKKKNTRKLVLALAAALACMLWKREFLLLSWQNLNRSMDFRKLLTENLDRLDRAGIQGLVVYTVLFALWEIFIGVTTPVETAAGMAFGVRNGIIASAIGKIGGCLVAFFISRYMFFDVVSEKLKDNEMMHLVQDSIREHPIGVALLWRFSPLPEQIKTCGLSVLPLRARNFIAAVVLHGLPFTCLWTCLGAEAGALAKGVVSAPSALFKTLVTSVYIFGFFISPTIFGLWVKSLKDKQQQQHKEMEMQNET